MIVKKKAPTTEELGTIRKYEGFLKVTAGIVGSLGVLYTALWAAGMAPITNAKTMEIIEDRIQIHQTQVVQNFKEDFKNYDGKLKDLDTNVKALSESNTRVDERTRQIIDEQKQQRDIQNKILMELQNSNKPKTQ